VVDMEQISRGERLAREFEKWQKEYYDEVYAHFTQNNKTKGNAAFDSWQRRFLEYLEDNLPQKVNEYHVHLQNNTGGQRAMMSVLENFKRTRGDAVESFLEQCIDEARKGYLDTYLEKAEEQDLTKPVTTGKTPVPKIFLSHSIIDTDLAEMLVNLLRSALNLSAEEIRCTSVEGHCLPGGAVVDEHLRGELLDTHLFISLITEASFRSAYVLFELGARWGAQKALIPLLGPGFPTSTLQGPIAGLNPLSCDSSSHLHQLIHDLGKELGVEVEKPNVYQRNIDRIISLVAETTNGSSASEPQARAVPTTQLDADNFENAEAIIRSHCKKECPNDFDMRSYCEAQQRRAVNQLKQGAPEDIPKDIFMQIRIKCASEWPTDFHMRRKCEETQFEIHRELKSSN